MAQRSVLEYDFNTGAGTQEITQELETFLDLSRVDLLSVILKVTKADADAGDTLDVYLQSRGKDGVWNDRVAFTQVTGDLSPSAGDPLIYTAALRKFAEYSAAEEESELSGSSGSHLAAGGVLDGPFPGIYRSSSGPGASWRVLLVVADGDNDADFEGTVIVEADSAF